MTGIHHTLLAAAILTFAADPARAERVELKLVERATTDVVSVHAGKDPDNVGDILTFTNEVFDADNKVKLGLTQGYCIRTTVGKAFECHWTLSLAQGQIVVAGPFLDTADSVLAIVGGTGAYSGARGEMKLHARDAKGSAFDFTYIME